MSISVNLNAPSQKTELKQVSSANSQANLRTQMNASIIQASMDVSISAKNEPLTLLYQSAIDDLNEVLKPELGDNAIQNATSQDNTPEGTAGRIVSLSTGFYQAYKAQHPGQDETVVLQKFMDTIQGGFEKGYEEAVNILQGLKVFDGDIASNVQKTHDFVLQGYADFKEAQSAQIAK